MPGAARAWCPRVSTRRAFAAAQEACASLRPSGGPGGAPGAGAPAIDSGALAAYTGCLKDHDVTVTTRGRPAHARHVRRDGRRGARDLRAAAPDPRRLAVGDLTAVDA